MVLAPENMRFALFDQGKGRHAMAGLLDGWAC